MAPSPSLFVFVDLIRRQNRGRGVPPHIPPQPRVLPDSPFVFHADFKLIVACLQNGGHPKAQASPLSALFFVPSNFAPPSERNDKSVRNPNNLRPAHGVGEQRRHDLMAPLLYPRRESKKPLSGGGSRWLLCVSLWVCVTIMIQHMRKYAHGRTGTHIE